MTARRDCVGKSRQIILSDLSISVYFAKDRYPPTIDDLDLIYIRLYIHTTVALRMPQQAPQVLVVGGGYGGMSVISSLLNLSHGGKQLPCPVPIEELEQIPKIKPKITLLDKRDGICMPNPMKPSIMPCICANAL